MVQRFTTKKRPPWTSGFLEALPVEDLAANPSHGGTRNGILRIICNPDVLPFQKVRVFGIAFGDRMDEWV